MSAPPSGALAERLGQSRIGLRTDLDVTRHVFRGEAAYVVRDPMTFQSHRLDVKSYAILVALRSDRTLAQTFEDLCAEGSVREADEDAFYDFVVSLHKLGFLQLPISDEKSLYKRYRARTDAKRRQKLLAPFFLQIPLFDPDAFLDRTIGRVGHAFSKLGFLLWGLVVGFAGLLALSHSEELAAPLGQVLVLGNLPVLWVTLIGLKVVHEFGHAYATKHFGGAVPEMGVYLIAGTPCAYVDSSSSWGFTKKSQRLFVCMAGMYVELFVAAVALIVWSLSEPGMLRSVAYNTMLLASVVTVGFNVNPLMRYDGYYALSDLLEMPNLRQRATDASSAFLKRTLLRLETGPRADRGLLGFLLVLFGLASSVYKTVVVLSISTVIASKAFLVGMTLGATYLALEVTKALRKAIHFLIFAEETRAVRARCLALFLLLFGGLPAGLFGIPLPRRHAIPAVVGATQETTVRARRNGFLEDVSLEPARKVRAGAALAELSDPGSEERLERSRAGLEAARLRHRALEHEDRSAALAEAETVRSLEEVVAILESETAEQVVRAPTSGLVVQGRQADSEGLWVVTGEPLATLASGRVEVRSFLSETQMAAVGPRVGDTVEFRSTYDPARRFSGVVTRVDPHGRAEVAELALTQLGGGSIAVDPNSLEAEQPYFEVAVELDLPVGQLVHGSRGLLRMHAPAEPAGTLLVRRVIRLVNQLRHGS